VGAGLGVDRQEQDGRELAARLGWQVVGVEIDNDVSASTGKRRPGYERLVAQLDAGIADAVIAWHADRLHRRPIELEGFVDLAERRGVVVATVKAGEIDLTTPSGRMVARMLGAAARHEVEQTSQRQKRKREQLNDAGLWAGGPVPYGFRPVQVDGGFTLEPLPDQAEVVREIVARLLSGESLRLVGRDLEARGVPSQSGRTSWPPSSIRKMVLHPRTAELVDPVDHAALVRALTAPSRRTNVTNVRSRLLSGVGRCGQCGGRLFVGRSHRQPVYVCESRQHLSRLADPIDREVEQLVVADLMRPRALAALTADDGPRLADVLDQAETVRERLAELATAYADDDAMTPGEYAAATKRLRERLAGLDEQATALTGHRAPAALADLDPSKATQKWAAWSLAERRAVIEQLYDVRVMPAGSGRRAFDPDSVKVASRG
jgi:DNA invertase Pin-like site-specific DNA recombinase